MVDSGATGCNNYQTLCTICNDFFFVGSREGKTGQENCTSCCSFSVASLRDFWALKFNEITVKIQYKVSPKNVASCTMQHVSV